MELLKEYYIEKINSLLECKEVFDETENKFWNVDEDLEKYTKLLKEIEG